MDHRNECEECWGTGFWHGHGGPCKRGCRSPSSRPVVAETVDFVPPPICPTNYMVTPDGIMRRIVTAPDLKVFAEETAIDGQDRHIFWNPGEMFAVVSHSSATIVFFDNSQNQVLTVSVRGVRLELNQKSGHIRVQKHPGVSGFQTGGPVGSNDMSSLVRDLNAQGRRVDPFISEAILRIYRENYERQTSFLSRLIAGDIGNHEPTAVPIIVEGYRCDR